MGADRRWQGYLADGLMIIAAPVLIFYLTRSILSRLDPDAGAKAEAQQKALAATTRLQSIFSNHDRQLEDESSDEDGDSSNSDNDDDGFDYSDNDSAHHSRSHRRRRRSRKPTRPTQQPPPPPLTLTPYEQTIAMEVISPAEIPITFSDIGGLDPIIDDLRETVIYPLTLPHLYSTTSSLLTAPSGVLLYGPPGCGKTMLAKALARESGAAFLNLHISTLTEKWYGDSNKLVSAVFSLARKLQPSIVFIDEIDAVLGTRRSGEHEASGMVKAEFMTHWDGLASATRAEGGQRIVVLGATNRVADIDEAILRRMPKKFPVGLPGREQRRRIFELTLRDTKIDRGVVGDGHRDPDDMQEEGRRSGSGRRRRRGDDDATEKKEKMAFDLDVLVRLSAGMSGSDIKEACREAAMVPVREYIKKTRGPGGRPMKAVKGERVRGLQTEDFFGMRGNDGGGSGGGGGFLGSSDGGSTSAAAARRELREVEDGVRSPPGSSTTEEVDEFRDEEEGEVEEVVRR
ncbi:ATPase family AAA domain-containing protein 1 [Hortaea werneckii]|uniref:AAA+ ATPase domain-containing protein n=1 Tax=Hortaea werneckii TaxID=91943 RepID=A0A3M7IMF4_HORWE|nr:ATPase family AAA domain-containing protein 1 [Hortaea werneckii]KAI6946003.1 ATPase family AAA domain-containing protein 1 [Hortaea werneckii]KAI6977866.1 ATPase family AAA domain-containing protein 1 [Hortaea werneckii]KAI6992343.1 ATPase family AAA domain-containing protein 1 [Hortaea werneckii]KAI7044937.1 ATPase family AAA domain-containing protein 1 [Hortaea werneckii]